jgi:P27 family predicted phage terminase small subunit
MSITSAPTVRALYTRAGVRPRKARPRGERITPPPGLGDRSREWWARLQAEYAISDSGGLAVLDLAAQAHSRMDEARTILDRDGITVESGRGGLRPHPAVVIERDARIAVVACLRQLGLDLEPVKPIGRPPGR